MLLHYQNLLKPLQMGSGIFSTDIRSALYKGCIHLASQSNLPSIEWNHHQIAKNCVHGVKHLKGSTSNIERYSQRPLSWLHLYGITAPSTVNPEKSSSNSHAFCSWSQTPSRQYQQYWEIFAVPSITVAFLWDYSAIYRHGVKHLQGSTSNIHKYS